MQLHFLGLTYTKSSNQIETIPSDHTARFLGQSYTPRCPVKTVKPQLGLKKYRGIAYGT